MRQRVRVADDYAQPIGLGLDCTQRRGCAVGKQDAILHCRRRSRRRRRRRWQFRSEEVKRWAAELEVGLAGSFALKSKSAGRVDGASGGLTD